MNQPVYMDYNATAPVFPAAAAAMGEALTTKDPANKLLEIARSYPNSTIAGKAIPSEPRPTASAARRRFCTAG